MRTKSDVFWGVVIVVIGFAIFWNMLGVNHVIAESVFYSVIGITLFLYSVSDFIRGGRGFRTFFTLYAAVMFLLYVTFIILGINIAQKDITPWILLVPVAVIALGSSMVFQKPAGKNVRDIKEEMMKDAEEKDKNDEENPREQVNGFDPSHTYFDIRDNFTTSKNSVEAEAFTGGQITSYFSGTELDLTKLSLKKTATIQVESLFSEVKIKVPRYFNIELVTLSNVFGAIEEHGVAEEPLTLKTLTINVDVKFGSVEIDRI